MTSQATDADTRNFFTKHNFFGLDPFYVQFFVQESMPCLFLDGRIILESKEKISCAPNGNGGCYRALKVSGMFEHMKKVGVEHVHSYSVDNILVKVAHPHFMAFCAKQKVDLGSMCVSKRDPHEKVGVFGRKGEEYWVVEYSEITKEMAERQNPNTKQLAFNASNIANFYYSRGFLEKCAEIMINSQS